MRNYFVQFFFLSTAVPVLFLASPGQLARGEAQPDRPKPIDGIEDYKAYEKWTISGGPEAAVLQSDTVKHSGNYSVRFRVRVNYKTAGNPKYPQGWLSLNRTFESPQDWSHYKALEFFLYVPPDQPMRGTALKYGISTSGTGNRIIWNTISPETLQPGAWTRLVLPFRRFKVRGDLSKVEQVRFYLAENWYRDGDELNFYLDDLSLLTEYATSGGSEAIRLAGGTLDIPKAYLKQARPVLYPAVPLEFIYSDTDISVRKPASAFSFRAARGEMKPLTFAILAGAKDIRNLSIEIDGLRSADGAIIPGDSFDVRVVKVWEQASLHWEVFSEDDRILVPELLLKDDRIDFVESRDEKGQYLAPHILNVPFGTDVPAHTLKQIWINMNVPENAVPGLYSGAIRLHAQSGLADRAIPLELEVLPFQLPDPRLTYGIYYRWRPNRIGKIAIPAKRFLADLSELKSAGFDALTIYDTGELEDWLKAMKEVGMRGPAVVMGGRSKEAAEEALAAVRKSGLDCYFYGVDEPNGKERFEQHKKVSAIQHAAGGKVMTAILPETAKRLQELGEGLDWANHSIEGGHSSAYIAQRRQKKTEKAAPFETYYWQVYEENPTRNRLLCGFYLWSSGLDGAFPYEYQNPIGLFYTSDTRKSMHNVREGGKPRTFRSWSLTYPSREGPVSTLQWEGCRQGITDVRYLTLAEQMVEELKKGGKTRQARQLETGMKKIAEQFSKLPPDPSVYTNPYRDPATFEKAREELIDLVVETRRKTK